MILYTEKVELLHSRNGSMKNPMKEKLLAC